MDTIRAESFFCDKAVYISLNGIVGRGGSAVAVECNAIGEVHGNLGLPKVFFLYYFLVSHYTYRMSYMDIVINPRNVRDVIFIIKRVLFERHLTQIQGKLVGKFYKVSGKGKKPPAAAAHEYKMLKIAAKCPNVVQTLGLFHMPGQASLKKSLGFAPPHGVHTRKKGFDSASGEAEGTESPLISALFMEHGEFSLQDFPLFHYTNAEAAFVGRSVLNALFHLHALGMVHRDIKPANILVGNGGDKIALGDFGLASLLNPDTATCPNNGCGTHGYLAPECLQDHVFCKESDVFAVGAVLYQLLFQIHAFVKENKFETDIATCVGSLPLIPCGRAVGKSDHACHLIRWLLDHSPAGRPTAEFALKHPWFAEVEPKTLRTFIAEKHRRGPEDFEEPWPVAHQNAMRQSEQEDSFGTSWTRSFRLRASRLLGRFGRSLRLKSGSAKVAPEFHIVVVPPTGESG